MALKKLNVSLKPLSDDEEEYAEDKGIKESSNHSKKSRPVRIRKRTKSSDSDSEGDATHSHVQIFYLDKFYFTFALA